MSESEDLAALKTPLTLRALTQQLNALLDANPDNGDLRVSVDGTVASMASSFQARPDDLIVEFVFAHASSP